MPFATGRATFTRFRCDAHIGDFKETWLGLLDGKAAPVSVGTGWAAGAHVLDREFTLKKNIYPERLLFDFCDVTARTPSELFKAYYETELKALSANNPSGYPSARQKREAKEAARDRLEQEAKDGRFLRRKCIPVLWDAKRREVLFGSTSINAVQKFWSLFEQTFEEKLLPVTAGRLCGPIGPEHGFTPNPSSFVTDVPVREVGWSPDETIPDYLGNEFVMWLWWHLDSIGDEITDITYFFSGGGKLECPRGMTGSDTLNHDSFVRMREAKPALRSGKWPRQVALTLVCRADQFSFKLQPETMTITGAKLPEVADDITDSRERIVARLDFVRDLVELIDQLYGEFILVRKDAKEWARTLSEIQRWIIDNRKAA